MSTNPSGQLGSNRTQEAAQRGVGSSRVHFQVQIINKLRTNGKKSPNNFITNDGHLGQRTVQWVNDAGFPANLISDHSLSPSLSLTLSSSVELVNGGGCGRLDASLGFSSSNFHSARLSTGCPVFRHSSLSKVRAPFLFSTGVLAPSVGLSASSDLSGVELFKLIKYAKTCYKCARNMHASGYI